MKTLMLVLLLCGSAALIAPQAAAQSDPNGWGPGEPGECVTLGEGEVRFMFESFRVVGNSLYVRERGADCFTKIIDLPFNVHGLDHMGWGSDEYMLFWSDQGAYRCGADGDSLVRIDAHGLLSAFLHHPIKRASATERHYGCHGCSNGEVDHDVVRPAVPSLLHEMRPAEERSQGGGRINGIDVDDLMWALRSVDIDPWRAPSVDAFEIDEGDLRVYAERVASDVERGYESDWDYFLDFPPPTPDNHDIFLDLPAILDTISPETIRAALIGHRNGLDISITDHYDITLVNATGDTLYCSFTSDGPSQPFCLPWTIRYGDAEFQSYSVELATLLMKLLPENEYRSEREEKIDLLYVIAKYLGEVRSRRGGGGVAAE